MWVIWVDRWLEWVTWVDRWLGWVTWVDRWPGGRWRTMGTACRLQGGRSRGSGCSRSAPSRRRPSPSWCSSIPWLTCKSQPTMATMAYLMMYAKSIYSTDCNFIFFYPVECNVLKGISNTVQYNMSIIYSAHCNI